MKQNNLEFCESECKLNERAVVDIKKGIWYTNRKELIDERSCIIACTCIEVCKILGHFTVLEEAKKKKPIKREEWSFKQKLSWRNNEEFMREKEEWEKQDDELEYRRRRKKGKKFKR